MSYMAVSSCDNGSPDIHTEKKKQVQNKQTKIHQVVPGPKVEVNKFAPVEQNHENVNNHSAQENKDEHGPESANGTNNVNGGDKTVLQNESNDNKPKAKMDSVDGDAATPFISDRKNHQYVLNPAADKDIDEIEVGHPESVVKETNLKPEGKDDTDNVSVYSLFMEKNFGYFFQHPFFRLFIAYFVTFCNFLIYAEDPVAHSEQECQIPIVGHCFSFVCMKYPPNLWSVLKVLMWVGAILLGLIFGKMVVHKLFLNRICRLRMFTLDHGSWMAMFFTTILSLFIWANIYNAFLKLGGPAMEPYLINERMGIKSSTFMKAAATGTWCGDLFTAWMVTDIMLQSKLYPSWGKAFRKWWNRGKNRIILFWIVVLLTSAIVIVLIATDWIQWDSVNFNFLPTTELSRAFLASFILVLDLMIVMQDWDFPHFANNFDVKLPGIDKAIVKFTVPSFLQFKGVQVHITGKWFNYGIIFLVMILDMNMWKNQIFYEPHDFGQYTNGTGRVFSVLDQYSLDNHNETYMNYEWRSSNINPDTGEYYVDGDMFMNSQYVGYDLKYKGCAFIPSMLAFVCFIGMIFYFGRWQPTPTDPSGGRLKRRKKLGTQVKAWWRQSTNKRKMDRIEQEQKIRMSRGCSIEEPSPATTSNHCVV